MTTNERLLLRESGAAERLGLSMRTLQQWRLKGGGPVFVKAGRSVLYKVSDLDQWIEERRRTSTSDLGARPGARRAPVGTALAS